MMLRHRVLATALVIAVPVTAVVTYTVAQLRERDLDASLERVVRSQMNDAVRERCEADPNWFLTGPLEGRPPKGQVPDPNSDEVPPRPRVTTQPFELFAYDEDFVPSSSAAPRFPMEFRAAMREGPAPIKGAYQTSAAAGLQIALQTGWMSGPCAYFLGRLQYPPGQSASRWLFALLIFTLTAAAAVAAQTEVTWRIRKLARAARESVHEGYKTIAPDQLKDELSSVTFVLNDASKELALRNSRIDDQDTALRRLVQSTAEDVARPLVDLESSLAEIELGRPGDATMRLRTALGQVHELAARVDNLTAAARLRSSGAAPIVTDFNLGPVVSRVVAAHLAIAHAAGVTVHASGLDEHVQIRADQQLVDRAIANLLDNAIRYNRKGGSVTVALSRVENGQRFRLWIADNGTGVSEEEFRGLTAIRRFRGDEHRVRRSGQPGLGLAVAREVAEQSGLTFDLKRPGAGGFEVEIGGRVLA